MERFTFLLCCFFSLLMGSYAFGQDTLPNFSVHDIGKNHIIIGWVNTNQQIKQIGIQRSFDSSRNYKTILTVPDPTALQNGYADTKAPNSHMFYRLFILQDGGVFSFTTSKRPVLDTAKAVGANPVTAEPPAAKDTPTTVKPTTPPVVKKPEYVPSFYVYTNKEGYVFINLPDAGQKKYSIKFYDDNGTPLFEIKTIKEKALTLDKANFFHAGWFKFELYNDEKLVEKNKFYLPKEF